MCQNLSWCRPHPFLLTLTLRVRLFPNPLALTRLCVAQLPSSSGNTVFRTSDVHVFLSTDGAEINGSNSRFFICRWASARGEWVPKEVGQKLFLFPSFLHRAEHMLVVMRMCCIDAHWCLNAWTRARFVFLSPHPHSSLHHVYCLKVTIASVASLLGQSHHID